MITAPEASRFARIALKGLTREFPYKPGTVLNRRDDARPPREAHPAFYGSFDWHSSVHGHWLLVRLLRLGLDLAEAQAMRRVLGSHLTARHLEAEAAVFAQPNQQSFERPYGWAWALKLAQELQGWDDADGRAWSVHLRPLTETIVTRYRSFLPRQTYPVRSGVHSSTAFGLALAHDYAAAAGEAALRTLVEERARRWFGEDADAPARWEPDGADFFSPALMEADLMRRVLPPAEFEPWLRRFLPGLATGEPASLFTPAEVSDRSDPQIVHLDGLNLSRAWCMRGIADALPPGSPAAGRLRSAATLHADAALPHVASGDYAGEHWLATFAVYLLTAPSADPDPQAPGFAGSG